ncbi:hypothetical protein E4U12_002574 [Claviceps purpurea]|nr:hypothetical protein E4U12_002574 [Claviceps purpurea]
MKIRRRVAPEYNNGHTVNYNTAHIQLVPGTISRLRVVIDQPEVLEEVCGVVVHRGTIVVLRRHSPPDFHGQHPVYENPLLFMIANEGSVRPQLRLNIVLSPSKMWLKGKAFRAGSSDGGASVGVGAGGGAFGW